MARPTKNAEDRKRCYSVTLTPAQKEVFEKLGGSPWLQSQIDEVAGVAQVVTPEALAKFKQAAMKSAQAYSEKKAAEELEAWQYNPQTRTWSPK